MITISINPPDTIGWLEATWVECVQAPDTEIPATESEPARTEPGAATETQIWCQSYHPTQIDMLRAKAAEYGTPLDEFEPMLAEWVASYEPPVVTPEQKRAELTNAVTALRWVKETGGLTLSNGITVGTKTEDQNRITTVIANAQLAGVTSVDFKAASGWVTLQLSEVQALAAAIALHVQACFSAERTHHEAIAALDAASLDSYDITTGWPA